MKSVQFLICVFTLFGYIASVYSNECQESESPIFCHGSRVVRNVIHKVLYNDNSNGGGGGGGGNSPLKLFPGLEIVKVPGDSVTDSNDARSNDVDSNDSYIGRASRFLEKHELKIKFGELMKRADIRDVVTSTFRSLDENKEAFEGRKKDKGGYGGLILMGAMMSKMMAAIGMGAIGALAAKALGVALMALMLAALVGLKKLTEHGHDDGGSHQVKYIMAHGDDHRRKRAIDDDVPLPYRGWPPTQS